MTQVAEIAPVPFAWTRGLVSARASALLADLFPRAHDARAGECIGIVKRFISFGRRSLTGHPAEALVVMGEDGRPVCLAGRYLEAEARQDLFRLEEILSAPGLLAYGALTPHASGLRHAAAPPRALELVLGANVHMLRTLDWQADIAARRHAGEPISRALSSNLRLLAEHPGSHDAVEDMRDTLHAQATLMLGLLSFDEPVLPALSGIAA
ncbi:hypothetical protein DSD19_01100 [Rhodovulum sp. BSW8]|uniref:Uncharacterized protein n=1 Tax=Rhodovulum visakhapatnamense TaxID=364297 RepID=A0A4R8G278_9RHOB|nr:MULTISPECIES: hypothetical protein [Rhodovulum]OLS44114.1 hypothetical protein BV509_07070 [Rhodovulum sulfidophilum]MBL3571123.1 hypothetical protein [Rhodovulum visakhapatnamense]MBL3579708.1 hypothetical protein [Rhodovulum visakhapatnamense]RBO55070.1 hypothetical protein DSD19_01100 [Rhodovulum sp. BSW8]TDX29197.1 hypothetical protein EV657_10918 [Rhodovulum visakhapatnamense]